MVLSKGCIVEDHCAVSAATWPMIARAPAQALTSAAGGVTALLEVAVGCRTADDPEPQPATSRHAAAVIATLTRVLLMSMISPEPPLAPSCATDLGRTLGRRRRSGQRPANRSVSRPSSLSGPRSPLAMR